jgi:hypothetical protein
VPSGVAVIDLDANVVSSGKMYGAPYLICSVNTVFALGGSVPPGRCFVFSPWHCWHTDRLLPPRQLQS